MLHRTHQNLSKRCLKSLDIVSSTGKLHRGNLICSFNRFFSTNTSDSIQGISNITNSTSFVSAATSKRMFSNTARDTRLAGRRRFYKIVNVQPTLPPWEQDKTAPSVESPISAGVDNTSAGVLAKKLPTQESVKHSLLSTSNNTNWYTITLDNRPLRTPAGNSLSLPSLSLALAIATEWDTQTEQIVPTQMPLMTLACTTLDQITYDEILVNCRNYLFNDTTCYFADPGEDRVLYRKQVRYWEQVHDYVQNCFSPEGDKLRPAVAIGQFDGMLLSRKNNSKGSGLPHPPELVGEIDKYLRSLNAWELICLQTITMEAKSLLVGISVLKSISEDHGNGCFKGNVKDFIMAARVEEEFQIENWGLVEGGHDYDRLNCSIQMTAATFLLQSLRQ